MATALFNFCKFSYKGCVRNVKPQSHICIIMEVMFILLLTVLKLNNVQGILARYWLASGIVKIIGENCPEVIIQNLSVY